MKSFLAVLAVLTFVNVCRANLVDVYATTFPRANPVLESVNLASGQVTVLGQVGWGNLVNDIAANPVTGVLYGLNGANPDRVTDECKFVEDLDCDDIDMIGVVMSLEEEFGMEIPDEHADKLLTVGDVVKYVQELTGEQ